ncbi:MAG: NUDIX domain-containing protein [Acidobacteriota bacterium]|nr:NUDIX domain-containing protein [Acidobacteriota bacterium]
MPRPRRSARVLVFDDAGRVLLIRYAAQRASGEFLCWLTPGGEIEAGESPLQAACRELREELELDGVVVTGPIREEQNLLEHEGELRSNTDYFFHTQCAVEAPRLAGVTELEIRAMREIRWWSAAEIAASAERFFPVDLVGWMEQVWRRNYAQAADETRGKLGLRG